jgi:HK97 family phage major capsid protein
MVDINRSDVSTIIQEAYSNVLLEAATAGSQVLQAFPTVNMGTKLTHLPVLAALPQASWVGESATDPVGVKPTTEVRWQDSTMVAEEIACIIPVHEDVIADATTAVLTEVSQLAGQAIGQKLDQAVLWGYQKPASWTSSSLWSAAQSASQYLAITSGAANAADIVGAVNQVGKKLALAGWMPDTLLANLSFRYDVENIRDSQGRPIFVDQQFSGFNTVLSRNAAWDNSLAIALLADASRVRIGVRQDITVKFLDQATLDMGGGTFLSLASRDMVALRFKARYAYVLGTAANAFGASRVPVGAIFNAGS